MSDILKNLKKNIPKYVPEVSVPSEDDVSVLRINYTISDAHASFVENVEDEVLRMCTEQLVEEIIKKKLYKISSRKGGFGTSYEVEIKIKNNA